MPFTPVGNHDSNSFERLMAEFPEHFVHHQFRVEEESARFGLSRGLDHLHVFARDTSFVWFL